MPTELEGARKEDHSRLEMMMMMIAFLHHADASAAGSRCFELESSVRSTTKVIKLNSY